MTNKTLLIGRCDHNLGIVIGSNRKQLGCFFTIFFYEKISFALQNLWKGGQDFLETGACLPYLLLSLSHQVTSPMPWPSWRPVKHSLRPWGRGEPAQHRGNCGWPRVPPKLPLSTAAVFQTAVQCPGQQATAGKALFSTGKSPHLPNPSERASPSAYAKAEVKICLSPAGNSFPLLRAQLPLGHREQKAKLFAIMYLKNVKKSPGSSHPFRSSFWPTIWQVCSVAGMFAETINDIF